MTRLFAPSLSEVKEQEWLGDTYSFLSLHFVNTADVPARDFTASISINDELFENKFPREFKAVDLNHLSINGKNSLDFPLIPIYLIEKKLSISICGVGLHAIDISHSRPESCSSINNLTSKRIDVNFSYTTLFDEKISKTSRIWLYFPQS